MLRDKLFILLVLFVYVISVESKSCRSMDIRNSVTELEKLRGCTEVVGSVQILLIERTTSPRDFDNYVFPELRKITGYLFFYNVHHLEVIGKLFPNLMVIRGYSLFTNYGLILYNMPHLREIGLTKLMFIPRGFVKVDKCPHLCFVNTIDWQRIGTKLDFTNTNNGTCDSCSRQCEDGYCWNAQQCQLKHSVNCHKECLACDKDNSNKHCWVCKNYDDHGTCVAECPKSSPKTYKQTTSFKCVTEEECRSTVNSSWWIYKDECVNECPVNYMQIEVNGTSTCIHCGNNCTKWCNVTNSIESIDKLQNLQGCTHIRGSLAIHMLRVSEINEQAIVKDLGLYLSSIRYISEALVISWTNTLQSLDFLPNLREIGGEKLENDRFAIFFLENKSLQKLWNFSSGNFSLKIGNGTLGFFSNPFLCLTEITTLANLTGISTNFSSSDVYANGHKSTCTTIHLNTTVTRNTTSAILKWEIPKLADNDVYIGFTVYYIDRRKGNITTFENHNDCGDEGWRSHFTTNNTITLQHLSPYTRYAYYIKTYQSSMLGAQTPVDYFTTLPSEPEEISYFEVLAEDDQTLKLNFLRPLVLNGQLSHYQLYVVKEPDRNIQDDRDYCLHPRTKEGEKTDLDVMREKEELELAYREKIVNCTCLNKKEEPILQEEISFLNKNKYIPLCDQESLSKFGFDDCNHLMYKIKTEEKFDGLFSVNKRSMFLRSTVKKARVSESLINISADLTSYVLKRLRHFTMYILYLAACNEGDMCGPKHQLFKRTLKRESADDISTVQTKVENSDVWVEWVEPKDPNGFIVSYHLEYRKTDQDHSKPRVECLSRSQHPIANRYVLTNLLPGSYSVRVQAESLAGFGRFSKPSFFVILAPQNSTWIVALISIMLILTILAVVFYMQYRRKRRLDNIHLIATVNPDYDGAVYVVDEWEIDRSDVDIQMELGHGTFGMVYNGLIISKNMACAVKTVNDTASLHDRMEFLNEASIMKSFSNSHHVVKLLGVVSKGQPPLVIMELMERGDLKRYLRRTRDSSQNITANEIYRMASEVADGMAYLAAKKFVHRDLAARNCMVANDRTVKVGDFGMARDIYETDYYRKETKGLLPVRWMAPESLADGVFTTDSDIWSYGIVLWEIATLAEQPYQGLSNEQVLQFVVSKGKLERPSECPDLLYEIMDACWCWRPNDRPTFADIVQRLEDHVGQDFKLVSFIHSREGLEHTMNHGRERAYNPPALGMGAEEHDLYGGHYNTSDEEVSLYVGDSSNRPRFLPSSVNQRHSRFSPCDL